MHVTARFSKVVGKQRLCMFASIVKVEGKCKNDTHQHLCPQGDSQNTPATLEDPLRLENESPSPIVQMLFKLLLLCWGWALGCVSLYASPFRAYLSSIQLFGSPGYKLHWF